MKHRIDQEVVQLYASFDRHNFLINLASSLVRNRKIYADYEYWQLPHRFKGLLFGHHGVNYNLIKGLNSLNVQIRFNSKVLNSRQSIGVLGGSKALTKLLSSAKNTKIIAGPNFYPDEPLLLNPMVQNYLVPSHWVLNLIENPNLIAKTKVWPVGIDSDYWRPNYSNKEKNSSPKTGLIYLKSKSSKADLLENSINKITGIKWKTITYGTYKPSDLRRKLADVDFCVYLGDSESQGIAQFACWSMNVPTFVFNNNERIRIKMNTKSIELNPNQYSVAPYLSPATGSLWSEDKELKNLINLDLAKSFSPRKWIIENASPSKWSNEYLRLLSH